MLLNSKQIAFYTGGRFLIEPIDASEILNGITWDSRDVTEGVLFVALPGEKVDGHSFVESAIRKGARAVLVSEAPDSSACVLARELGVALIEVSNTYHAISDLAREWRAHINGQVVAITGSVGKTTTKNLIRDVLSTKYKVVATSGNQNNELGVPKTILNANPDTEIVVCEMGMCSLGEIEQLCKIARPDLGVITNIGDSHMELLGSRDNIAKAKAELLEALPMSVGRAVLNADDPYTPQLIQIGRLDARGVELALYSSSGRVSIAEEIESDAMASDVLSSADKLIESEKAVWAENVELDVEGRACFTLCANGFVADESEFGEPTLFDMAPDVQSTTCHLSLRGLHNVANACAASAVGLMMGISLDDVARDLNESIPESGRMETLVARDGFTVINDAYNASPDSMRASLGSFCAMGVPGRRIAVLGDMGELGDISVACHEGIGRYVATLPIDGLICIGELSRNIARCARECGMNEDAITEAPSIGSALEALEGKLGSDDAVLVKASHFMGLDRLVEGLIS